MYIRVLIIRTGIDLEEDLRDDAVVSAAADGGVGDTSSTSSGV